MPDDNGWGAFDKTIRRKQGNCANNFVIDVYQCTASRIHAGDAAPRRFFPRLCRESPVQGPERLLSQPGTVGFEGFDMVKDNFGRGGDGDGEQQADGPPERRPDQR